jgi:hypothetical protein
MGLVNALGSLYFKGRKKSIAHAISNYKSIQDETLRNLISDSKTTSIGLEYNFANITHYQQYAKALPIFTYEEFYPYIEKMLNGEQKITWNTPISWFAKSSGTTNDKSKFIPISYENLENCHFEAGKDILSIQFNRKPNSKLFEGKGLLIGGSNQTNPLNEHSNYGDLSAVLMNEMPFWANLAKTPDLSIALLEKWDEKVEKMAHATMEENVTSISGVPTWTLVLLKKVLETSGKNSIREVWPNLELFIHGGISFTPYREQFFDLIGDRNVELIETYNASEGFFGVQLQANEPMTLMPQYGIYYEFLDLKTGHICNLENAQAARNYELIISTNTGLWRYRIGDTIQFIDKGKLHFKLTGRTKHFINAFGEELMVDNADKALNHVCSNHNTSLIDYTAAPLHFERNTNNEIGTHEWLICLMKAPENPDLFKNELDMQLRMLNSDYEAKRKDNMAMSFPKITITTELVFEKWLRSKNKLGGQHKVPRLANSRKTLEEVKKYLTNSY